MDHKTNTNYDENYLLIFVWERKRQEINLINIQWWGLGKFAPENCYTRHSCGEKINVNVLLAVSRFFSLPQKRGHYQHSHCDNKFEASQLMLWSAMNWIKICLLHTCRFWRRVHVGKAKYLGNFQSHKRFRKWNKVMKFEKFRILKALKNLCYFKFLT